MLNKKKAEQRLATRLGFGVGEKDIKIYFDYMKYVMLVDTQVETWIRVWFLGKNSDKHYASESVS